MAIAKTRWDSVVEQPSKQINIHPATHEMELCVFGCKIRVKCSDDYAHSLLVANYASCDGKGKDVHLRYFIRRARHSNGFTITRNGLRTWVAGDGGDLLSLLEKDLTINLQMQRPDLYFLHSAALEFAGRAFLLVAPSGGGKSTTTWGLLHHGFRYMSDELAPIRLDTMRVYPYPHAICLKAKPPYPYVLPDQTFYTSRTIHIPAVALTGGVHRSPIPLTAVFFLQRGCHNSATAIAPVSKAEAAARLYATALNALAHKREGLDAAAEIASKNFCSLLTVGDLSAACALMRELATSLGSLRKDRLPL